MTEEQKGILREIWKESDLLDRSTIAMIAVMKSVTGLSHDKVIDFLTEGAKRIK